MSMNSILLLGAGFSHNWDAPLSREVANSLLRKVHNDAYLQALLTKHEKNFEDALSEIQQAYVASPSSAQAENRLVKLQAAIVEMFERLNGVLERHSDRKSTRLNSSHLVISYAVFCLKKKKQTP